MLLVLLIYNLTLSKLPGPLSPSVQMAQAPSIRTLETLMSVKLHTLGLQWVLPPFMIMGG